MIRAQTRLGPFTLGTVPRVVGTVSKPDTRILAGACDIVELRLDLLAGDKAATSRRTPNLECASLLALCRFDQPAIATIRLASEGGKWTHPDADRLPLFDAALRQCAAADIELRSAILEQVSELACRHQKALIVSCHDFARTPPLDELRQVLQKAASYGTVVKIATLAETDDDVATLQSLFQENCSAALCVLGMGARAAQTRREFPKLGSCLTYGYLDEPVAPGQPSARDLMASSRRTSA